jgi:hypothetical protein
MALAVAVCGILWAGCSRRDDGARPLAPARGPKLIVLGLDGATWRVAEGLVASGRMPKLAALRSRGAWGTLLSLKPMLSPIIWTTIASGREAREHGIGGFLDHAGHPVNSSEVRVKRVWDVISERSRLSVGVVGWYVTWPAESVAGFQVSDRAHQHQLSDSERGVAYYPPALRKGFEAVLAERRARYLDECRRFTSLPLVADWRHRLPAGDPLRAHLALLDKRLLPVYLRDSTYVEAGLQLYTALRPDVFFLYLRGADYTQHVHWFHRAPEEAARPVDPEELTYFGGVIDEYYAYLDEVLGRLAAAAGSDVSFAVVSDHGFKGNDPGEPGPRRGRSHHESEGLYVFSGPAFRRAGHGEPLSILDLAPLWLHTLGLPVARDLPGRVALETCASAAQPAYVDTYGPKAGAAESRESGADADIVEQLRALGYIN